MEIEVLLVTTRVLELVIIKKITYVQTYMYYINMIPIFSLNFLFLF